MLRKDDNRIKKSEPSRKKPTPRVKDFLDIGKEDAMDKSLDAMRWTGFNSDCSKYHPHNTIDLLF